MRCIETKTMNYFKLEVSRDKLQHEMYWNLEINVNDIKENFDKLQHEMYWNLIFHLRMLHGILINYNMRCIETKIWPVHLLQRNFDKLQHEMYWNSYPCPKVPQYNDKLQHEMYWNSIGEWQELQKRDKLQHEMYWNFHRQPIGN